MSKLAKDLSEKWQSCFTKRIYAPGDKVFALGEPASTCVFVLSGSLYQTSISHKTGNEVKINEFDEGSIVDGLAFRLNGERNHNCYADSRTECIEICWSEIEKIKSNLRDDLFFDIYSSAYDHEVKNLKEKLSFCEKIETDPIVDDVVLRARSAQSEIISWSDEKLDRLIEIIASAVEDRAEEFARQTVKETGIGEVAHKVHKLSLVHGRVLNEIVGTKTIGKLANKADERVAEYASPVGVIFAVIPITNPIPNSLFKLLLAIKTRNALIVSYPSKAVSTGSLLIELVKKVMGDFGGPKYLFQSVPLPSNRQRTADFMGHRYVDLVLATGGSALVKAAHSSGNPAYGVGPGNVPVLVCKDADVEEAAQMIVSSKAYDNGIICGSENNLVVESTVFSEFNSALIRHGAAILTDAEKEKTVSLFFTGDGGIKKEIIGKSAKVLMQKAGIHRDYAVKVIVIIADPKELQWLGGEKLAPILSMFQVDEDKSLEYVVNFLEYQGAGHTAVIHSRDKERVDQFSTKVPAGRLLVNTPSTFGMMGVSTDLPLSFMLGSGTWGGNITTEGITWRHFVNIKRLAYHANDVAV